MYFLQSDEGEIFKFSTLRQETFPTQISNVARETTTPAHFSCYGQQILICTESGIYILTNADNMMLEQALVLHPPRSNDLYVFADFLSHDVFIGVTSSGYLDIFGNCKPVTLDLDLDPDNSITFAKMDLSKLFIGAVCESTL